MKYLYIEISDADVSTLFVRGDEIGETSFDRLVAVNIVHDYARMIEFEQRLRWQSERDTSRHEATAIARRMESEILTGEFGLAVRRVLSDLSDGVQIRVEGPPELVNLPWELLRSNNQWLALHPGVEILRVVPHEGAVRHRDPDQPLRILFIGAEPRGLSPTYSELAWSVLQDDLWCWRELRGIELKRVGGPNQPVTLSRVRQALGADIVYVLAHGRSSNGIQIALTDDRGTTKWTPVRDFVRALGTDSDRPRLLILACCHLSQEPLIDETLPSYDEEVFGGFAVEAVKLGIDRVIAMQSAVSVGGAAGMAAQVLKELRLGKPLSVAVRSSRERLQRHEAEDIGHLTPRWEWSLPVVWSSRSKNAQSEYRIPVSPPGERDLEQILETASQSPDLTQHLDRAAAAFECFRRHYVEVPERHQRLEPLISKQILASSLKQVDSLVGRNNERAQSQCLSYLRTHCAAVADKSIDRLEQQMLIPILDLYDHAVQLADEKNWQLATEQYEQIIKKWRDLAQQGAGELCRLWKRYYDLAWQERGRCLAMWHADAASAASQRGDSPEAVKHWQNAVRFLQEFNLDESGLLRECQVRLTVEETLLEFRQFLDEALRDDAATRLRMSFESKDIDPQIQEILAPANALSIALQAYNAWRNRVDSAITKQDWYEAERTLSDFAVPQTAIQRLGSPQLKQTLFPLCGSGPGDAPELSRETCIVKTCQRYQAWSVATSTELEEMQRQVLMILSVLRVLAALEDSQPDPIDVDSDAFRLPPVDLATAADLRKQLTLGTEDELFNLLDQVLGDDAVVVAAQAGFWESAWSHLTRRYRENRPLADAVHRYAVCALLDLDQPLTESSATIRGERVRSCVGAWCVLLSLDEFWDPQRHTARDYRSTVRRQLAEHLQRSSEVVAHLESPQFLRHVQQEWREYIQLCLEMAGCALVEESLNLDQVRQIWDMTVVHAGHRDLLKRVALEIRDQTASFIKSHLDSDDVSEIDRVVPLVEMAHDVLQGTTYRDRISPLLAEVLSERGILHLEYPVSSESYRQAVSDFARANEMTETTASTVGYIAVLAISADKVPSERREWLGEAHRVLTTIQAIDGDNPFIHVAKTLVHTVSTGSPLSDETVLRLLTDEGD